MKSGWLADRLRGSAVGGGDIGKALRTVKLFLKLFYDAAFAPGFLGVATIGAPLRGRSVMR